MIVSTLTAATVTAALTPFLTKTGEKISEKIGEDIFPYIKKIFIKDEEPKTIELIQKNPSIQNLKVFEEQLLVKLENSPDMAQDIAEILKLTPFKSIKLGNIISSA